MHHEKGGFFLLSPGVDDSGCSPSGAGDIPSGASGFPVG